MNRTVLLFPGQGAYFPGALRDLRLQDPQVSDIFAAVDRAAAELNEPECIPVLFEQSPRHIDDMVADAPDVLQLALFGVSVALFKLLQRRGVEPWTLLGHSVGDIAALTCAGAFSVEDGARIMHLRNRALRDFAKPGHMMALGTDAETAATIVRLIGDARLDVACRNTPRQTVLSGPDDALERVAAVASAIGTRHHRLRAAYPFHSRLLEEVVEPYRDAMTDIPQRPLKHSVYSTVLARPYRDDDDIHSVIAESLLRTVHFHDAVRRLRAWGADVFVECGARQILSGLVTETVPRAEAIACLTPGSSTTACLDAAVARLHAMPIPQTSEPAAGGVPETVEPVDERDTTFRSLLQPDASDGAPNDGANVSSGDQDWPAYSSNGHSDDRSVVIAELRTVYARALEYPEEIVTEDADLEADLGVDSVQQTEILARVADRFGIPPSQNLRMADYPTISAVADLVQRARR